MLLIPRIKVQLCPHSFGETTNKLLKVGGGGGGVGGSPIQLKVNKVQLDVAFKIKEIQQPCKMQFYHFALYIYIYK